MHSLANRFPKGYIRSSKFPIYDYITPNKWLKDPQNIVVKQDVAYVPTHQLVHFFNSNDEVPTVVCESGDAGIYFSDGLYRIRSNNSNDFLTFKEWPKWIKRVFAVNLNCNLPMESHSLPLGCPYHDLFKERNYWAKSNLLYINFNVKTNRLEREPLYQMFPWAQKTTPYPGKRSREPYIRDLLKSKFVLCPQGNGVDTYRVWEALYCGAIPVVETSRWTAKLKTLPVVTVQDYACVTESMLLMSWDLLNKTRFQLSYLNKNDWVNKIG